MKPYLHINKADNVAVVLCDEGLAKGCTVDIDGKVVTLVSDVARGHKFAIRPIAEGEEVVNTAILSALLLARLPRVNGFTPITFVQA